MRIKYKNDYHLKITKPNFSNFHVCISLKNNLKFNNANPRLFGIKIIFKIIIQI